MIKLEVCFWETMLWRRRIRTAVFMPVSSYLRNNYSWVGIQTGMLCNMLEIILITVKSKDVEEND